MLFVLGGPWGCGRREAPPPVESAQIPVVLRDTFKAAKEPLAGIARELIGAVEAGEWAKASVTAQVLSKEPALTAKQRELVARCLITINTQVTEAAATGNQDAQEVRRMIRQDK